MLKQFDSDLQKAQWAEKLVQQVFQELSKDYKFKWVGDQIQYRYKGDVIAETANGRQIFIEVKADSVIAESGRILCEEENYIKSDDRFIDGNMKCDSDVYVVVSESERKMYVLDFKKLQSIYRKGEYKRIPHEEQDTYCYLLELCRAKQWGALIAKINY